jgi:hypothetical protein
MPFRFRRNPASARGSHGHFVVTVEQIEDTVEAGHAVAGRSVDQE